MYIPFGAQSPNSIYRLMTQFVIPRPIAWVLSDNGNEAGSFNLAPFSYFNAVCSDPPLVMISIGKKPSGEIKDTRANILAGRPFVIHIPSADQAEAVTTSSKTLAHGESELDHVGETLVPFEGFSLPRLANCPVALGCSLFELKEIGSAPQALVFAQIEHLYLDDKLAEVDNNGHVHIDPLALNPLSRLGGNDYGLLGEVVSIARPK